MVNVEWEMEISTMEDTDSMTQHSQMTDGLMAPTWLALPVLFKGGSFAFGLPLSL